MMKKNLYEILNEFRLSFISPDLSIVDEVFVEIFHEVDVEIWPWTIKTEQQFKRMKMLNIQAVVTDIPQIVNDLSL